MSSLFTHMNCWSEGHLHCEKWWEAQNKGVSWARKPIVVDMFALGTNDGSINSLNPHFNFVACVY